MARRILVIEDEPSITEALSFLLTRDGWTVHVHGDGATAATRVRDGAPALVVLDAMLPGRSGFDVLREVRADSVTAAVPILMLTARGGGQDRDHALRLGATGFMTKPFANADLLAEVRRLAGSPRARMARKPRFLAPAAYRQRRLRDAARLLPILGLALLMVPLLWTEPPSGSRATLYVFAVWALLVAGAALVGRGLDQSDAPVPPEDGDLP